jgi:hypothetical protein
MIKILLNNDKDIAKQYTIESLKNFKIDGHDKNNDTNAVHIACLFKKKEE